MNSHHSSRTRWLVLGGLVVGSVSLWQAGEISAIACQQPVTRAAALQATGESERAPEKDAIQKAIAGLVAAFQKGDAKAVAVQWTAEGEYTSDDGTSLRGHAALEK